MPEATITYEDATLVALLRVRQATVLDGIRRGNLVANASDIADDDIVLRIARLVIYPAVVSATLTADVRRLDGVEETRLPWPMDFETFIGLPAELVDRWLMEVYLLNPSWNPSRWADESKKKAAQPSAQPLTNG